MSRRHRRCKPSCVLGSWLPTRWGCRSWEPRCAPTEDHTAELARTGVAVLVLHGESDDAWPPAVQAEMAERLGAAHVVIAAAAHSPAVENSAATVRALIEFWQQLR